MNTHNISFDHVCGNQNRLEDLGFDHHHLQSVADFHDMDADELLDRDECHFDTLLWEFQEHARMKFLIGSGEKASPHLDTAHHIETNGFDGLVAMMESYRSLKMHRNEKPDYDWYSPVVLTEGTDRRTTENIDHLAAFIAFDIDTPGWSLPRLKAALEPLRVVMHTTTNSRPDHQRWRIVAALDRSITVEEHPSVWRCFNGIFDSDIDPATKGANRFSYMPAQWSGADNEFEVIDGVPMDVDLLLQSFPIEVPLPPHAPEIDLQSMPDDVCLITQKMIDRHTIAQGGRMFRILCAAATNARIRGWTITTNQLYREAIRAALIINHRDSEANLYRECQRAIDHIARRVMPKTKLQRVRDRIEFEEEMMKQRRMKDKQRI